MCVEQEHETRYSFLSVGWGLLSGDSVRAVRLREGSLTALVTSVQCSSSVIVTFSRYWHRVREAAGAGGPPLRCLESQQNCQLETISVNYTCLHSFLHSLFHTSNFHFVSDLHLFSFRFAFIWHGKSNYLKWQTKVHQIQIRKLLLWWMVFCLPALIQWQIASFP